MATRWKAGLSLCVLNVALAAAYYAAARLGLATSIGPGQVTAVWPPSGLALAALMVWSWRALPGLALGSFLLNWLGYLGVVIGMRPEAAWGAAWLSSGSMLQAVLAAAWLRSLPSLLAAQPTRQTLRFVGAVALCCTLAATIGTLGLMVLGLVSAPDWWHGWLTWWVGDTAGMLVIAPPLLLWLHQDIRRDPISSLAFPILCMGVGLTLVTSFVVGYLERQADIARFRAGTRTLALMVQNRIDLAERDLEALQAFHYKVDVDELEFHAMAGPMLQRGAWHLNFAWLPRVASSSRAAIEQEVAREPGAPADWRLREIDAAGRVTLAGARPNYLPVRWVTPTAGYGAPLGVDELIDPLRHDAIVTAETQDRVSASLPIGSPLRAGVDRPVVTLYAPIWQGDLGHQEQRTLRGEVSTTLDLGTLLGAVGDVADLRDVSLLLHDPQAAGMAGVSWDGQSPAAWSRASQPRLLADLSAGLHEALEVQLADRTWQLIVQPHWAAAMWRLSWLQAGVFSSGLAFTALLTGFMVVRRRRELELQQSRRRLEAQVAERTRDLAQANDELRLASERADAANRAKSLFLANMSHEIRTPLNAVLGYAQLLREDAAPGTTAQSRVQTILDAGQRLLRLINDVLDLSKIEAGSLELRPEVFDLRREIDDVLALFGPRARAKGLRLEADVALVPGQRVQGDRGKFGQVLVNLLGNALKFTDTGHVALHAWRDDDQVHVEITDTGPGIAEQDRARLFSPFTQGSAGHDKGGTGLGLVVARHIARAMGGDLTLDAPPQGGTRVRLHVCLPQADDSSPDGAVTLELSTGGPARIDPATPCRALVVDDDADSRDLLAQALRCFGCEVAEAVDGEAGCRACAQGGIDIVFTDIRMPVLDGSQMLLRLRAQPATAALPVIAVSASSLAHERSHYIAQGFQDFVGKPYAFSAIQTMLQRYAAVRWLAEPAAGPAAQAPSASMQAGPAVAPDAPFLDGLRRLADAAAAGDVAAVRREMAVLEGHPAWSEHAAQQLAQAARAYDFEAVEQQARAWAVGVPGQSDGPSSDGTAASRGMTQ